MNRVHTQHYKELRRRVITSFREIPLALYKRRKRGGRRKSRAVLLDQLLAARG